MAIHLPEAQSTLNEKLRHQWPIVMSMLSHPWPRVLMLQIKDPTTQHFFKPARGTSNNLLLSRHHIVDKEPLVDH